MSSGLLPSLLAFPFLWPPPASWVAPLPALRARLPVRHPSCSATVSSPVPVPPSPSVSLLVSRFVSLLVSLACFTVRSLSCFPDARSARCLPAATAPPACRLTSPVQCFLPPSAAHSSVRCSCERPVCHPVPHPAAPSTPERTQTTPRLTATSPHAAPATRTHQTEHRTDGQSAAQHDTQEAPTHPKQADATHQSGAQSAGTTHRKQPSTSAAKRAQPSAGADPSNARAADQRRQRRAARPAHKGPTFRPTGSRTHAGLPEGRICGHVQAGRRAAGPGGAGTAFYARFSTVLIVFLAF